MLLAENKHLKEMGKSVYSFDSEIEELWDELMKLKKKNMTKLDIARKKMRKAYIVAYVSWILLVVLFIMCD